MFYNNKQKNPKIFKTLPFFVLIKQKRKKTLSKEDPVNKYTYLHSSPLKEHIRFIDSYFLYLFDFTFIIFMYTYIIRLF